MLENGLIALFIINKQSFLVTFKESKSEEKIPFDAYFDKCLKKEDLSINDKNYTKDKIITFIKDGVIDAEICFETSIKDSECYFKIFKETPHHFGLEVGLRKHEQTNNDSFDYLTKVHSRSYLFSEIQKELDKGNNDNSYLIMIDLDNFKTINDTYGHLVGDVCLKTIASKLDTVFANDIFGRYGGDEFIAFVKGTSHERLKELIAEALQIKFSQSKSISSKNVISCSLGISSEVKAEKSINALIEEADKILYKSKQLGKNIAMSSDGKVFYGSVNKRKKIRVSKGQSSLIFREEISRKRTRNAVFVGIILFVFSALIATLDIFLNFQVNSQSKQTALNLMEEKSDVVTIKVSDDVQESFAKLESSKEVLDEIDKENEEALLDEMISNLSKHALLATPGVLLENGDIYLGNKERYNVSTFDFATKIISNNERAIERISIISKDDQIVIGVPYKRTFSFGGSNSLDVLGITSMYSAKEYSSLIFNTISSEDYICLVDSKTSKICESNDSEINIFAKYSNFKNYFSDNDLSDEYEVFLKIVNDNDYHMDLMNLGGVSYFVFASKVPLSDWSILMLTPYQTIVNSFNTVINFSAVSLNSLSFALLFISLFGFFYLSKIKMAAFSSKYIDPLTNSINEQRFLSDANILVSRMDRKRYLIYLNIRGFKVLNSTLGNEEANKFLLVMSSFLENNLKDNEILSREYSDRFLMLLEETSDDVLKSRIDSIAQKILNSKSLNKNSRISFDIGIYGFEYRQENKIPIWLAVDRAKKAANEISRSGNAYDVKFFNERMLEDEELEVYIEQSQETALKEEKFQVYYQGKYDLHTKRFAGCEALVRWKDERKGFINTQKFIDVFERNGFVSALDLYIFEKVLKDLKALIVAGQTPLKVSVNLSRKHFEHINFFDEYVKLVEKYQIPWKYLEFEITESIILNDSFDLNDLIKKIHEFGAMVSIDDFGSGFSNFSMINHVDYDILKIDRKLLFGKNKEFDQYSKNVIKSVVSLNKNMNKITLCEGVEHKDESDYLESVGCDLIQGYYYAKPLPKEEFFSLVEKTNK